MSESDDEAPAVDVLLLGGVGSGKTLLVRHLAARAAGEKLTDLATTTTTGVELDEIGSGSKSLAIWEVGAPMTPMWHTYYGGSYMIAYMIDVTNAAQVSQAVVECWNMLAHDKTQGLPVAIVLNKGDVGASVGQYKLRRLLRFDDLVAASGRELKLFEVSAKTGAGLGELESWMRATKAKRANKGKK